MFGFSLAKLVVLAGIVLLVWYGFKLFGRAEDVRETEEPRRVAGQGKPRSAARPRTEAAAARVEDMVKCRTCGAYVPAQGASACGQAGCPYGAR